MNKYLNICIRNRYLVSSITVGVLCVIIAFAVQEFLIISLAKVDSGQFFINAEAIYTGSLRDTENCNERWKNQY